MSLPVKKCLFLSKKCPSLSNKWPPSQINVPHCQIDVPLSNKFPEFLIQNHDPRDIYFPEGHIFVSLFDHVYGPLVKFRKFGGRISRAQRLWKVWSGAYDPQRLSQSARLATLVWVVGLHSSKRHTLVLERQPWSGGRRKSEDSVNILKSLA